MKRHRGCSLLAIGILSLSGCGAKLPQVSGIVTLDEKPLESGNVMFSAVGKAAGIGTIQPDGTYTVKTGGVYGLAAGDYQVTVSAYRERPSPNMLDPPMPVLITPAKYNSPETSGLTATIKPGGNTCNFALMSK